MSRRRYISTEISVDEKVNRLPTFAALLYTWSIPHFTDDCRLTPKNAVEVKWTVVPARKEGVKEVGVAIMAIVKAGLWGVDKNGQYFIDSKAFYKWQTYISAANRRETPENTASPSPSLSSSPSLKEDIRLHGANNKAWPDDDLWLKEFLESQELIDAPKEILLNHAWWLKCSTAVNGFDSEFLSKEFAKIGKWCIEKPSKRPTRNGWLRFIGHWLEKAENEDRRFRK